MIESKAGAPGFASKYLAWVERLVWDKPSSLYGLYIINELKIYNMEIKVYFYNKKLTLICELAKLTRVFDPGKPLQPNLIFASKAPVFPSGAAFRSSFP